MRPWESAALRRRGGSGVRKHRLLGMMTVAALISACGADFPVHAQPSDLGCQQAFSSITDMRSSLALPPYFSESNPVKRGGEFDPNRYFEAFTHLKMRDGYMLDWVYHQDGMGGYPVLYARPVEQPPFVDESSFEAVADHPDYLEFVEPQDSSEGYFEYAAFAMTANQFYLDWHANYNDWQVVCGIEDVDEIIQSLDDDDFPGRPMTARQQQDARAIVTPHSAVVIDSETATVTMLVFTKWGGFYRRTLVIDRATHSILDEQDQPLVEYDCGIAF